MLHRFILRPVVPVKLGSITGIQSPHLNLLYFLHRPNWEQIEWIYSNCAQTTETPGWWWVLHLLHLPSTSRQGSYWRLISQRGPKTKELLHRSSFSSQIRAALQKQILSTVTTVRSEHSSIISTVLNSVRNSVQGIVSGIVSTNTAAPDQEIALMAEDQMRPLVEQTLR